MRAAYKWISTLVVAAVVFQVGFAGFGAFYAAHKIDDSNADPKTMTSDQFDTGMEYAGYAPSYDRVVFRGDPSSREFIAFWMRGERVVAGMNFNVWDVNEDIQALIRSGCTVADDALRDADVALSGLAVT